MATKMIDGVHVTDAEYDASGLQVGVMLQVSIAHKIQLEKLAKAQGTSTKAIIENILAQALGWTVSDDGRRSKYGSKEEAKAAQKQKAKDKADKAKIALDEYREREGLN